MAWSALRPAGQEEYPIISGTNTGKSFNVMILQWSNGRLQSSAQLNHWAIAMGSDDIASEPARAVGTTVPIGNSKQQALKPHTEP